MQLLTPRNTFKSQYRVIWSLFFYLPLYNLLLAWRSHNYHYFPPHIFSSLFLQWLYISILKSKITSSVVCPQSQGFLNCLDLIPLIMQKDINSPVTGWEKNDQTLPEFSCITKHKEKAPHLFLLDFIYLFHKKRNQSNHHIVLRAVFDIQCVITICLNEWMNAEYNTSPWQLHKPSFWSKQFFWALLWWWQ